MYPSLPSMASLLLTTILLASQTHMGSASATCPAVCRCRHRNTVIACVDRMIFDVPRLPTTAVTVNLSKLVLGPNIVTSFSYMPRLAHLDLSRNHIVRVSRQVFNKLEHLTSLDLSHNRVNDLEVDLFVDNRKLEILDLSHNAMTSFNSRFYRHLPNLKRLNLAGNNFFQLKLGLRFQVLNHLRLLDLSSNDFGDIKNDAFEHIDQWSSNIQRTLHLAHCSITSVENGTFVPFRGLYELDLTGTTSLTSDNISLIVKDIQHTNTKRLHVSYLGLTNIDTIFTDAPKLSLEHLNLSHNNIEGLSDDAFTHLGSLQYLDMSHNEITDLPLTFSTLSNVRTLNVSNNRLKAFNASSVSLTSLEVLLATHNDFSNRSLMQMDSLEHLRILDLSFNDLSALITVGDNVKLEELILSGNNISSLDIIPDAPSLRKLDVSRNKIATLGPYMFSAAVNIEIVDFSDNLISLVDHLAFLPNSTNPYVIDLSGNQLKYVHFGGWASARVLNISNNRIAFLDFHAFQGMNNLEILDLSSNVLEEIHDNTFKYLINLKSLNLAHNRLESSFNNQKIKETFATLVELRSIDMSWNDITYLDPNVFGDNNKIENVTLAKNKLSTISPKIFMGMERLENFDISNNPFICDCAIIPLVKWLKGQSSNIFHNVTESYKCAGPFYRTTKSILDFNVTFFECDETLLNLIVFGSLGLLTIIVGVVGTVVCRSYQKWSMSITSQKHSTKKKESHHKTHKSRWPLGRGAANEVPFEVLNELDHSLKTKLWQQNGSRHIANGGPVPGKQISVKAHQEKEDSKVHRKVSSHRRCRSQSKSRDDKTSRSRSKSKERPKSRDRDRREQRDREQIRRFEKELRNTLARYNRPNRWGSDQRDRWATLGHWDWVNKRDYDPDRVDRFYTMPSNRLKQPLLDDQELLRRSSHGLRPSRGRTLQVPDRSARDRDHSGHVRRVSPAHRYDVVRAGMEEDRAWRREYAHPYSKQHHRDMYVHYPLERGKPVQGYSHSSRALSSGGKRGYDDMEPDNILYIKPQAPKLAARGTQREYVALPFPDVMESRSRRWELRSSQPELDFSRHVGSNRGDCRTMRPDPRDSRFDDRAPPRPSLPFLDQDRQERPSGSRSPLQCHRSRSYGEIDFQSKRQRYKDSPGREPSSLETREDNIRSVRHETDRRTGHNEGSLGTHDPRSQANSSGHIGSHDPRSEVNNTGHVGSKDPQSQVNNTGHVEVEIHKDGHCKTPDPDYPMENPRIAEWL